MPRTARKKSCTDIYHGIGRGINHERIFNQTREKNNFIRLLKKYLEKYAVEIYAYAIMSTHFHLILRADLKVMSGYLASVLAEFAEYYNYKHGRNGHVFQNRFISECIEDSRYFWNCIRYVHMNPVNANIVKNPLKYRFSSLSEYQMEKDQILHPAAIKMYKEFFSDFEEYIHFHEKNDKNIFLDIPGEIEAQQKKVAMDILIQETYVRGLGSPKELLEEKELRRAYMTKIIQDLGISKTRAQRLYRIIKRGIIGK